MLTQIDRDQRSPAQTGAAKVMLRNVGYNFAARAWFFALTFLTTPALVRGFGSELFGLYGVVAALGGYFAVLDLGLGVATIKYVAEYRGRREDEAVAKVVGTAVSVYLLLGVIGAGSLSLGANFLVDAILHVPPGLRHVAWLSLQVTALGLLITMPLSILNAIPTALQRMDITNRRNVLFGTVTAVGSVVLVLTGRGLVEVLAFGVAVSMAAAVSFAVTAHRLLPGFRWRLGLDRRSLRQLSGFGLLKFANQVSTQTVYHFDKILLAAFVPLAVVGHYVIALTLAQRLSTLVGNVAGAFLPAASQAHGHGDRAGFKDLYLRGTKLVALIVFPVGVLLMVFAHPILLHWIGPDVARETTSVLLILTVAYVVNAFSTMPAVACDGLSRPGLTTVFSIGSAVLNVALVLLLVPQLGGLGAGYAVLVNSVVLVPLFIVYVHRRVLQLSIGELARKSLARPALATMLVVPVALALRSRVTSLSTLLVALGITSLTYFLCTVVVGAYDATDRSALGLRFEKGFRTWKAVT